MRSLISDAYNLFVCLQSSANIKVKQSKMDAAGTQCISEVKRTAVSLLYHLSVCASVLTQLLFSDTSGAQMHGRRPADHRNKKKRAGRS